MNKEEILAKAQKENKNVDLIEVEIDKKAGDLAAFISTMVCFILYVAENMICHTRNYSLWSVIVTLIAVINVYKGVKLKDKKKIILGICWAIISVVSIATAVITLLKTAGVM